MSLRLFSGQEVLELATDPPGSAQAAPREGGLKTAVGDILNCCFVPLAMAGYTFVTSIPELQEPEDQSSPLRAARDGTVLRV